MRRRGLALGLLLLTLLGGAALVVSLQRYAVAEATLRAALQQLGIRQPQLRVTRLGPRVAHLEELRLGPEAELSARRVELHYSPTSLAAGRLTDVRVEGLELRVALDEAGLSLGFLEETPSDAAPGRGGPPVLPFEAASLEAARVRIDTPLGAFQLGARGGYTDGSAQLAVRSEPFHATLPDLPPLLVPALDLAARLVPGAEAVAFEADLADGRGILTLRAEGRHDIAAGRGDARLRLEPLHFESEGLQPEDLLPALAEWISAAAGHIEGRGHAVWGAQGVDGTLDLAVRDLSADLPLLRVEGLDAAVHVAGPSPVWLPGPQLLSMARLDFGLELTNGLVRYGMRRDGVLEIESAEWEFAGGRIRTSGDVDLAAAEQEFLLEISDVDLALLLERIDLDGLSGEGRVDGRLPLVRRAERLEIRGGRLTGRPEGGWIRYRPLGGAAALGRQQQGFDALLGALRNLRYETLVVRLDGDTHGEVQLGLQLHGTNPEYQAGRSVQFNLNLEGALVDLLRKEEVAYRIPQAIEQRISEIVAGEKRRGALDRTDGDR